MTREEKQKAIDALKTSAPVIAVTQEEFNDYIQTLNKIMDWLEQGPCDDAISRQSAIFLANDLKQDLPDDAHLADMVMAHNEGILEYQTQLSLLPSVNPQSKTGHWICDAIQGEIDGKIVKAFICSECGAISVFRITDGKIVNGDLCPNCGAKM